MQRSKRSASAPTRKNAAQTLLSAARSEKTFTAVTVLCAVASVILWLSKCVKASYKDADFRSSLDYTLREICNIMEKDRFYVPLLALCIVCTVFAVLFALLQLSEPSEKKLYVGGAAAAAAMCASYLILFFVTVSVYKNTLLNGFEGEAKALIAERVHMGLSGVGLAAAAASGLCLIAQLLGLLTVPARKNNK